MVGTHRDIPRIHKALRVEHDLCATVVVCDPDDGGGYAHIVAEAQTGEIIAWDGIYSERPPREQVALADVDWNDWDDMPAKLLLASTEQWASDRLAGWLLPTFSPARSAARMVFACNDQVTTPTAATTLNRSRVVAYLPIVDRDVYERDLEDRNTPPSWFGKPRQGSGG